MWIYQPLSKETHFARFFFFPFNCGLVFVLFGFFFNSLIWKVSLNCILCSGYRGIHEWRTLSYPRFSHCSNKKELQRDSCFPKHILLYKIHQLPVFSRNQCLQPTLNFWIVIFPLQRTEVLLCFYWPRSQTACPTKNNQVLVCTWLGIMLWRIYIMLFL